MPEEAKTLPMDDVVTYTQQSVNVVALWASGKNVTLGQLVDCIMRQESTIRALTERAKVADQTIAMLRHRLVEAALPQPEGGA